MFNMVENAGDNAGYELRIRYDADINQYYVTAYVIFKNNYGIEYSRDGASRDFDSMEEAVQWIQDQK